MPGIRNPQPRIKNPRLSHIPSPRAVYLCLRDGPLQNLWEGGRGTKKIFAQWEIKRKKIHARQLTLRNIHAMTEKKIIQGI